uniref:Uncharacterized protein n=1 Tax=Tetradesmus obliquus TaxID=3088 RepID=A0A383VTK2_TETOB|eukprot:jgi/Sobl393_1/14553/SZX68223.1
MAGCSCRPSEQQGVAGVRPQQDYRGVWLRHFAPMNQRSQAAPAGIAFTGKPAQTAEKPVIARPGNAYRRRVAGDNWM